MLSQPDAAPPFHATPPSGEAFFSGGRVEGGLEPRKVKILLHAGMAGSVSLERRPGADASSCQPRLRRSHGLSSPATLHLVVTLVSTLLAALCRYRMPAAKTTLSYSEMAQSRASIDNKASTFIEGPRPQAEPAWIQAEARGGGPWSARRDCPWPDQKRAFTLKMAHWPWRPNEGRHGRGKNISRFSGSGAPRASAQRGGRKGKTGGGASSKLPRLLIFPPYYPNGE